MLLLNSIHIILILKLVREEEYTIMVTMKTKDMNF